MHACKKTKCNIKRIIANVSEKSANFQQPVLAAMLGRSSTSVTPTMKFPLSAWICSVLLVAGCQPAEDRQSDAPQAATTAGPASAHGAALAVTALADDYVDAYFEQFPEQALLSGAPDPDPGRLSDPSLDNLARWQIHQQDLLAQLDEIDTARLEDPAARTAAGFLRNQLESARDFGICRQELWNVSPTWTGWLAMFTELAGKLRMDTDQQRADALSRLSQIPDYVDTETGKLREGVELGYTAAASSVRAVVDLLDAFLALPAAETPFAQAASAQDIAYRQKILQLVEDRIKPAIGRYRDYLKNDYAATARRADGVDANPDGAACYRAAVRYWATLDLGAGEIHRIGLEQMTRVLAEIGAIGARSFGERDPLALLRQVKSEPQYLFKSREQMIAYAEAALVRAEAALPAWFGRIPKAPVVVEPYPAFQEMSAPSGQAAPASADGSQPARYLINTYQAEKQSIAGLEATAFYEADPGHHTQITIAQERSDLHPMCRYFFLSGFGEGWALYAERLADEMGLYSGDLDRLGMLANEAWRAARLVVDSGIHGFGWSREQAVDYLDQHTTNTHELNVAEVDRYIAVPGQATSYLLGALEIRRLREQARASLGQRFDIRAFHDRVLEDGAVPLGQLAEKVQHWIGEQ
jgi:uncharacterized protein (DUF885 family)